MFKIFKKYPRRTKSFYSAYFAAIFSGLVVGIFFTLITNQEGLPEWETSIIKLAVWIIATILLALFLYYVGMKTSHDLKERQNFHDNYFISLISCTTAILLIIFNDWIRQSIWNWLITFGIFIISYFPVECLFLKIKRPQ